MKKEGCVEVEQDYRTRKLSGPFSLSLSSCLPPPGSSLLSMRLIYSSLLADSVGLLLCLHGASAWPSLDGGLCPSDLPTFQLGDPTAS